MTTATIAPFREDRQFGEPYAANEQVYRTIGITSEQMQRLPKWVQLAIARADATILRREARLTEAYEAIDGLLGRGNADDCECDITTPEPCAFCFAYAVIENQQRDKAGYTS